MCPSFKASMTLSLGPLGSWGTPSLLDSALTLAQPTQPQVHMCSQSMWGAHRTPEVSVTW